MKIALALMLIGLNSVAIVMTSKGFGGDRGAMISTALSFALGAPIILAAIYCAQKKYRNRNSFINAFNFVAGLLFFSQLLQIMEQVRAPPKQIQGRNGLIEITVPNSWDTQSKDRPELSINVVDRISGKSVIVGVEAAQSGDLEQHLSELIERLEQTKEFKSKSGPFTCSIQGFECLYHEVEFAFGKSGTTTIVAAIEGRSYCYHFVATTTTPAFERDKELMLNILLSLREKVPASKQD